MMVKFKVLDRATGREVSAEKVDRIAKEGGLMRAGIDQFFMGEDGRLILADDCGRVTYVDSEKEGFMPGFESKYPDLEYLEAVFLRDRKEEYPVFFEGGRWEPRAELVAMFPQIWPNTAGGLWEPGMVVGDTITTEITTVMRFTARKKYAFDGEQQCYGIFFGDRLAYIVEDAGKTFWEDVKNRDMKSRYDARKEYKGGR